MSNAIETAERALALLALFRDEGEELRVSDVSLRLGVHKSTASRLAATLESSGFLARAGRRDGYRLGPEVARLGILALGGRGWAEVARPTLERLAGETGEAAVLSVANGTEAHDVLQATAPHVVGATSWVGRRTPLHATSDGKVFLAFGAGSLPPHAPLARIARGTVTSRTRLDEDVARVRDEGYATAISEAEDGLNGVAVPIFDRGGSCIAALSVFGPDYRVSPARLPDLAKACSAAAAEIRDTLGWNDARRTA